MLEMTLFDPLYVLLVANFLVIAFFGALALKHISPRKSSGPRRFRWLVPLGVAAAFLIAPPLAWQAQASGPPDSGAEEDAAAPMDEDAAGTMAAPGTAAENVLPAVPGQQPTIEKIETANADNGRVQLVRAAAELMPSVRLALTDVLHEANCSLRDAYAEAEIKRLRAEIDRLRLVTR